MFGNLCSAYLLYSETCDFQAHAILCASEDRTMNTVQISCHFFFFIIHINIFFTLISQYVVLCFNKIHSGEFIRSVVDTLLEFCEGASNKSDSVCIRFMYLFRDKYMPIPIAWTLIPHCNPSLLRASAPSH